MDQFNSDMRLGRKQFLRFLRSYHDIEETQKVFYAWIKQNIIEQCKNYHLILFRRILLNFSDLLQEIDA